MTFTEVEEIPGQEERDARKHHQGLYRREIEAFLDSGFQQARTDFAQVHGKNPRAAYQGFSTFVSWYDIQVEVIFHEENIYFRRIEG